MPQHIGFLSMDFFVALMIIFFVIGILSQILIGILYQHMIEETENMQTTANKILKQLKQKFVNCYTVNDGVTNVPVFVEKFINRLQIGRLSLNMLRNLSGQCMFLSVLSAGIGICRGFATGMSFWSLLPYYVIAFIGLYLYFSVLSIVDIPGRRNMLKTNLIDYLENHMKTKLAAAQNFSEQETARAELSAADSVQRSRPEPEGEWGSRPEPEGERRSRPEPGDERRSRPEPEGAWGSGPEPEGAWGSGPEPEAGWRRAADSVREQEAEKDAERRRVSFEKKRMPVVDKRKPDRRLKPDGLDWTGGMAEENADKKVKACFDKEKEEELAELLKDLLS